MAQITLSEYLGFIFSEIVRARENADRVSKGVATEYAKDPILKEFSVPRFKIPEMDLTIPVLISGARYSSSLQFNMTAEEFIIFINNKLKNIITTITFKNFQLNVDVVKPVVKMPLKAIQDDINQFYHLLKSESELNDINTIINLYWAQLFNKRIDEAKLRDDYKKHFPKDELFIKSLQEVTEKIRSAVIVTKTSIQNLLVNPETNIVKNESSDSTVFIVKAKIKEEGIFIRTIKDVDNNEEKQVVEFE